MRIGINPAKVDNQLEQKFYHRIVIPVYIPHLNDYFRDAFKILKICLQSIYESIHKRTAVTIINNGCCKEVSEFLQQQLNANRIDVLIHNGENKGKIDPLVGAIRGCYEKVITITDADVLFHKGWQEAVERILASSNRVGMVSPVPLGSVYKLNTSSTIIYGLLRGKLRFNSLADAAPQMMFAKSIGRENEMFSEGQLKFQLSLRLSGEIAIVGCGHFVATLRREIINYAPKIPSNKKIVGNSETLYIDVPNDKAGFLRLATTKNYAFHMGNVWEDWMKPDSGPKPPDVYFDDKIKANGTSWIRTLFYPIRLRLASILLSKNSSRKILFKIWGLNSKYSDSY